MFQYYAAYICDQTDFLNGYSPSFYLSALSTVTFCPSLTPFSKSQEDLPVDPYT